MSFAEILARLKNVKGSGTQRTAKCPAHKGGNESSNSLSVSEAEDGRVLFHCHAGCDVNDICAAIGITVADLFPPKEPTRQKKRKEPEKPLTVEELARAKGMPLEWLREQGVDNFPDGSGVAFGYFNIDGSQHARLRKRTSLGKDGWTWTGPAGESPIPYGRWRLNEWRS